MATFTTTAADNYLKTIFEDPITDQVVQKSDVLDFFESNVVQTETDEGQKITVAFHTADPEGVGARAEGDYIPVAEDPEALKVDINLKYIYGRVQMSKQVMQRVVRGKAAFIDWADVQLRKLEKSVRNDLDRQLCGYGAGIVARVDDASPDRTLGVDSAYGVAGVANATKLFRVGARYRFFATAAAGTEHNSGLTAGAKVQSVDHVNNIVTFESGATDIPSDVADNDYIIRGDAAGHSGQNSGTDREVMGLFGHIDDGDILATYFGKARSTYTTLKAQNIDGSASPYNGNLTETLLMKLNDDCMELGGGDPDAALTTRGVLRNFFAQLKTDRTMNDPMSFTGGARDFKIQLGDKAILLRAGRLCPEGTLFMVDRSTLKRYHNAGWEWAEESGAVFKQVSDSTGVKDEFYGYGRWFLQTFCNNPQANGRIDGLDESVA